MSSVIAAETSRGARHAMKAVTIAAAMAALTLGAGCVDDRNQPSNQTTGTVVGGLVGGAVGGLAFGSVGGVVGGALVGALAGNLVGRALDNQERARLAQATQQAFTAPTNQPTTYTVEPTRSGGTASGSATATNTRLARPSPPSCRPSRSERPRPNPTAAPAGRWSSRPRRMARPPHKRRLSVRLQVQPN